MKPFDWGWFILNDVQLKRRSPYLKLKALLVERDVSQRELSKLLGKTESALSQNLNGTGGDFSLSDVRVICEFFDISADDYFVDH